MTFDLPDLPFAKDALEPHMSPETFDYHHAKHHAAYVGKLNELIAGTDYENLSLEEICIKSELAGDTAIFNNAAQHWNHSFFWTCLSANGGESSIPSNLASKIDADLGGYEKFKAGFINACMTQFGSGWGWLVLDNATRRLEIIKTPNAKTPITKGKTPLMTCDVWEHAYYIDYRNSRPKFVESFLDNLANWENAAALI